MKFDQIFLLLFTFPFFINGKKECIIDGKCYLPEDPPSFLNGTFTKECNGSCFAFKCLNYTTEITYGSGCYEDFINACKWVDPKIKEDFKGKKDYKYFDETAIIVACEEGLSNCAISQFKTYEKGNEIEQNHGKTGKNGKTVCKYDNKPLPNLEKRKCTAFNFCVSYPTFFDLVKNDNSSSADSNVIYDVKECTSPCATFICVSEGKYIMEQGGCYEDIKNIYTNVLPSEAQTKMKDYNNNFFYFDENILLVTCTNRDDCHLYNFKAYRTNYIYSLKRKFGLKIMDKKSNVKCEYILIWSPSNQVNITEGSIECNVLDFNIHLADGVSCFFFKLPYIFYDIKFGYFTIIFPILVILISLFGRIKLHYRWFILNMAILDFLNGYGFICGIDGNDLFTNLFIPREYCALNFLQNKNLITIIYYLPTIGLFVLTGSRFLSLYFPQFYKSFAKTWKIILTIIITDLFFILIITIAAKIDDERGRIAIFECFNDLLVSTNVINVLKNSRKLKGGGNVWPAPKICVEEVASLNSWSIIFMFTKVFISQTALFASIVFIIMLVIKISRQLKFQAQSNKEMLKTNIRIITVFTVQTIMLFIIFAIDAFIQYADSVDLNIFYKCPFWLQWIFNQKTLKCLREIRVFIDSFIILALMSGYREDLFDSIIWIFKAPKRIFKGAKNIIKKKNSLTPFGIF